jgi:hypothetical protein
LTPLPPERDAVDGAGLLGAAAAAFGASGAAAFGASGVGALGVIDSGVVDAGVGVVAMGAATGSASTFERVIIFSTARGVPKPGPPSADSSFKNVPVWPMELAAACTTSFR